MHQGLLRTLLQEYELLLQLQTRESSFLHRIQLEQNVCINKPQSTRNALNRVVGVLSSCTMVFCSIRSNILHLNSLYKIILIFILPPCKCVMGSCLIQDQDRFTFVTVIRQVSCFIRSRSYPRISCTLSNYVRIIIICRYFSTNLNCNACFGNLAFWFLSIFVRSQCAVIVNVKCKPSLNKTVSEIWRQSYIFIYIPIIKQYII